MTEVVTPSPSDPKKTFDRQSTISKSSTPSGDLHEYEKTILSYTIGLNEPSQLESKHEQHPSSDAHVLPRATVTPGARAFDEGQVVGPKSGNGSRNARVTHELDHIAEHAGEN